MTYQHYDTMDQNMERGFHTWLTHVIMTYQGFSSWPYYYNVWIDSKYGKRIPLTSDIPVMLKLWACEHA